MPFPGEFDKDFLAKSITGTKIGQKLRQVSADVVKIFPWDSRTCDLAVTGIARYPRVSAWQKTRYSFPVFHVFVTAPAKMAHLVQILNQLHCLAWSKSVLFPFKMSSLPLCKDDFGGEVTWTVRVIVGWSNGVEFNLRKIVLEVSLCREVKKSNWVRVLFSQVKVLNKLCHKIKFVTQCMVYSLIAYFCFIHSME